MSRLDEIRSRWAGRGPWFTVGPPWLPPEVTTYVIDTSPDPHFGGKMIATCDLDEWDEETGFDAAAAEVNGNLEAIAHAPEDIAWLLERLEESRSWKPSLRARLDWLLGKLQEIGSSRITNLKQVSICRFIITEYERRFGEAPAPASPTAEHKLQWLLDELYNREDCDQDGNGKHPNAEMRLLVDYEQEFGRIER